MRIEIICTGDEVLTGKIINTNFAYMSQKLEDVGLSVGWETTVGDDRESLLQAFRLAGERADAVIVNGGLGPTIDDLSQEIAAQAAGVELVLSDAWVARMEEFFSRRSRVMPPNNRKQAMLPEGAELIDNPVSRAPGFRMENVYVLAGVPEIMRAMFDGVKSTLEGGKKMLSRAVNSGVAEGILAEGLGEIQARYPDLEIGSYPYFRRGAYGTSLVLRGVDPVRLGAGFEEVVALVREHGGEPVEEPMS
jgi:nicotinamide-nucleotide amidase